MTIEQLSLRLDPVKPEEWRPVVGFSDYEVSDWGRVRSLDRFVPHAFGGWARLFGRVLAISYAKGYGNVVLRLNNESSHTRHVHILVLEAFVGRAGPGQEAAHWDGNPSNNRLHNLRWTTKQDNERDKIRHGTALTVEQLRHMGLKGGKASLQSKYTRERRSITMSATSKAWWAALTPEARAKEIEKRRLAGMTVPNSGRFKPGEKRAPISDVHRENLSKALKGKKRTPDQRAYLSAIRRGKPGRPLSDETKEKIRQAQRLSWRSGKRKQRLS